MDAPRPNPAPTAEVFTERTLRIPARLDHLGDVREFVEAAAEELGFDPSARYEIRLAVTEAVTNAVQHGSTHDDDPVELRVIEEDGALAVYVADRGTFVPRVHLPDELPERGRGLEFMSRLMDEVEVRPGPGGTVVRLSRRPSS